MTRALNKTHDMVTESNRQMLEAHIELQKEMFERQDKRDRSAEAASALLQSSQAMPREQVLQQHINHPERPAQDIDTLLKSHLETTEQRMLRHMHSQFGQSGELISHLAGRVDNIAAAAHAIANKPPPEVVVQQTTGPAGPPGPPGAGAVTSTINASKTKVNQTMILKLKSRKHAGLAVSASSNPPPPPGAPGASAMLNPVVEAPAQLQAPNIDVPLTVPIVNYPPPPPQQFVSNIEERLEARLAQVKGKPVKGPHAVARTNALADDARAKRKEAKRTMLEFDQRPRVPKRMAAEQGGRPNKPAPPSRVPEAPAPLPTKKVKYEPVATPTPKRSGRATSSKGRSSGRAPKPFALTDV